MATDSDKNRLLERDDSSILAESSDSSDNESGGSSAEEAEDEKPVEWLATGRARRSTAGNRMKAMLANEEAADVDSDLELLFAEDEDDAGFTDEEREDVSDVLMDSSSDEEEGGAAVADDDESGERELQRQAKEQRAAMRKRRAQDAIPARFRKKVKINMAPAASPAPSASTATTTTTAAQRAAKKKKSERASWLPSPAEMPTRASERKTTRLSKEQLHAQMAEREQKRQKQMKIMAAKAKRLEALKKPPLTQAQRLAEAAEVEKRNANSLNLWQAAEKQREEERLAKLAALNSRTLKGPVVTFWSGIVDLSQAGEAGSGLQHVGKIVMIEDKPRRKRQSTAAGGTGKDKKDNRKTGEAVPDQIKSQAAQEKASGAPAPMPAAESQADRKQYPPTLGLAPPIPPVLDAIAPPPTSIPAEQGNLVSLPQVLAPPVLGSGEQTTFLAPPTFQAAGMMAPLPAPAGQDSKPQSSVLAPPSFLALPAGMSAPSVDGPVRMPGLQMPSLGRPSPLALPNTSQGQSPLAPPPPAPEATHLAAPPMPQLSPQPLAPVLAPMTPTITGPGLNATLVTESSAVTQDQVARPFNSSHPIKPELDTENGQPARSTEPIQSASQHLGQSTQLPSATKPTQATESPQLGQPTSQPTQSTQVAQPEPPSREVAPVDAPAPSPAPPTEAEKVTRSCIILQNFDEEAIKDPNVQTQILFGRRMNKLPKPAHPPLCVITHRQARYRDLKTGLPFHSSQAYKELKRLRQGEYNWSQLLGAWVGSGKVAARGVPAAFLGGAPPKPSSPAKDASSNVLEGDKGHEPKPPGQMEGINAPLSAGKKDENAPGEKGLESGMGVAPVTTQPQKLSLSNEPQVVENLAQQQSVASTEQQQLHQQPTVIDLSQ